jgi:tRNA 2-selenouridine synthase
VESNLLPEKFSTLSQNLPIIDVRSPGEYAHAHIPGAVNLPLFSDDERAAIGTVYKQQGRDQAVRLGLKYTGPKIETLIDQADQIAPNREVILHCWRGGMRSNSMKWLLQTAGYQVILLKGGYKAYRHYVLELFKQPFKLYILSGKTGSGKTEILQLLHQSGEAIIDLEALANHKGSSFGGINQIAQPGIEQFENNLAQQLIQVAFRDRIWVESESRKIGCVVIPEAFWNQMQAAPIVQIDLPLKSRIQRLVEQYGQYAKEELVTAILRIRKRLGGLQTSQAIDAVNAGDLETAVGIILTYYDKTYQFSHQQKEKQCIFRVESDDNELQTLANNIVKYLK